MALCAIAMTAPTNAASAPVGPHDNDFEWVRVESTDWRKHGLSYVDDGFRAPLVKLMASRAPNGSRGNSARSPDHMFMESMHGSSRSGSPSSRTGGLGAEAAFPADGKRTKAGRVSGFGDGVGPAGTAVPVNGTGAKTGLSSGFGGGAGTDTGSSHLEGVAPALTELRDGLANDDGVADPVLRPVFSRDSSATDTEAGSIPITPVPVPASAILLIAGLGGFVLLMRRRVG